MQTLAKCSVYWKYWLPQSGWILAKLFFFISGSLHQISSLKELDINIYSFMRESKCQCSRLIILLFHIVNCSILFWRMFNLIIRISQFNWLIPLNQNSDRFRCVCMCVHVSVWPILTTAASVSRDVNCSIQMLSKGREHQPVLIKADVTVINCATDCRFAHETNTIGSLRVTAGSELHYLSTSFVIYLFWKNTFKSTRCIWIIKL